MEYDLWCAKFNFISWQLRLFLSDFEMWSCCISPYTSLFKLDPEVKVIKVPICFRSRAFPSTVCVVSLTQYCKEGDHSHTEISAAWWGGEKMCSGQYGYNFWNNTLPQTITCSSSMNSLISKPQSAQSNTFLYSPYKALPYSLPFRRQILQLYVHIYILLSLLTGTLHL